MDEELAGAQQKAAELVLEDEAWRDGLEDEQAKALLDEALAMVDQAVMHHACEGALNEDLPYVLADEARAMLREKAAALLGSDGAAANVGQQEDVEGEEVGE